MTKRQFYRALRRTERTWSIEAPVFGHILGQSSGPLRCGYHCPVTKVAADAGGPFTDASEITDASEYLHLSEEDMNDIVEASDWLDRRDRTSRALLRACGAQA